ncbi:MAG: bifunctional diaminohydroxyphosphoribosylaminopyrimidine deaminase/5-amino-6-(5-phosphoribosylamino)uracil reductase RibD [Candidatus Omnitrophica bacterium]|nr:bifunctional diaminohydroxyphosphoribosylaminopyrimidine deaminase/5-amino-6-(5-phosphoribosylamino)uracil reductase RibD [Candidatus Omnitrophota bacterium]
MRKNSHEYWMRKALELAGRVRFSVSPNPKVGAVVVKSGRLIASGYHQRCGGPHAEINAIKKAGRKARGAVLYVTLEPCSSWGKTPPCVGAIQGAGISSVVIGAIDPNPKHCGRAVKLLQKSGIRVLTNVLADEVRRQNKAFFKRMKTGRPYVTLKMAQSVDGKIATSAGQSKWITGRQARAFVQHLRAGHDAILIGKNTFLKDNPRLTVRGKTQFQDPQKPWRIVINPKLEFNGSCRILQGKQQTFFAVHEKQIARIKSVDIGRSINVIPVHEKNRELDLKALLKTLASLGANSVLAEGGGELAWSLLKHGLVDKLFWITAPKIIGGRASKTSVEGSGVPALKHSIKLKNLKYSHLGNDFLLEADL